MWKRICTYLSQLTAHDATTKSESVALGQRMDELTACLRCGECNWGVCFDCDGSGRRLREVRMMKLRPGAPSDPGRNDYIMNPDAIKNLGKVDPCYKCAATGRVCKTCLRRRKVESVGGGGGRRQ